MKIELTFKINFINLIHFEIHFYNSEPARFASQIEVDSTSIIYSSHFCKIILKYYGNNFLNLHLTLFETYFKRILEKSLREKYSHETIQKYILIYLIYLNYTCASPVLQYNSVAR